MEERQWYHRIMIGPGGETMVLAMLCCVFPRKAFTGFLSIMVIAELTRPLTIYVMPIYGHMTLCLLWL